MADTRPIAISCGEPAGVGPEIVASAWAALKSEVPMIWVGDPRHLPADLPKQIVDGVEGTDSSQALPVLARDFGSDVVSGQPNPQHARGVIEAIQECVHLTRSNAARAICTAPIHKAALIEGADFDYPGHTEFLAALADVKRVVMMLACDALRVVPTTIHISVKDVPQQLTSELLRGTIEITHAALKRDFGIAKPRIAVAGLNPHAGEDGNMGMEEIDMMRPLLANMRSEGFDLSGPLSADTMFHPTARANYDTAVCMYHDQALIPIKTLDFSGGVNVTLGLPFIRTSPDHGTAFDIAGKGVADATSMIAALRMAMKMSNVRDAI